ncbi:MAG: hypothetical protein K0R66_72 [Gammaproteobacteria bacterium]|jgi:hypothetical protein|nr:hypothetical protein [Gammaproteobacteria bacterium]
MPKPIHLTLVRDYQTSPDTPHLIRSHDWHHDQGGKSHYFDPDSIDATAYPDFSAAELLLAKHNALVMVEGLAKKLDCEDLKPEEKALVAEAKRIFPDHFPENYDDFSEEQKAFLNKHGAARTLFYCGELAQLYPLNAGQDRDRAFQQVELLASTQTQEDLKIVVVTHAVKELSFIPFDYTGGIESIERHDKLHGNFGSTYRRGAHLYANEHYSLEKEHNHGHIRKHGLAGLEPHTESLEAAGMAQTGLTLGLAALAFCACFARRRAKAANKKATGSAASLH